MLLHMNGTFRTGKLKSSLLSQYFGLNRPSIPLDTTDTDRSASYLDLHLEMYSEGRLRPKYCDKRDDFNFPVLNVPFICSNIPAAPGEIK
jgi:hypothetical protein